jgi:hypothetical protein
VPSDLRVALRKVRGATMAANACKVQRFVG